jgi:orotidine-5'-phosphate decarboxylase
MLTEAVRATRAAARRLRAHRPLLLGVTVLTSAPASPGRRRTVTAQVRQLARQARAAGLDGVVASAEELPALRRALGRRFLVVTPGIRPRSADRGDQRRVMTPAEAVRRGADFLVVGRPITGAADPARAARQIRQQMRQPERHR